MAFYRVKPEKIGHINLMPLKKIINQNMRGLLTMSSLCTANSFIPDDTDIQEACPEFLILDVDVAKDEEID